MQNNSKTKYLLFSQKEFVKLSTSVFDDAEHFQKPLFAKSFSISVIICNCVPVRLN